MKRLLIVLFVLLPISIWAQDSLKLELMPKGFFLGEDKDYIVLDYKGKTATELYESFLTAVNSTYVSGKDVVSTVPNKNISISAFQESAIEVQRRTFYDIHYNISFFFKDDKVRINAPEIQRMKLGKNTLIVFGKPQFLSSVYVVYNKKGKLKNKIAKKSLEDFFSNLINLILKEEESQEDW